MMKKYLLAVVAASLSAFASTQTFYASCDKFGYTGSMDKYSNLADAQAEQNSMGTYGFSQRDGGLYVLNDAADFGGSFANANIFLTAWYYTTDPDHGEYSGWGNPNNNTDSFVQLYDGDGVTHTTKMGGWTSASYDAFHLEVVGENATYDNSYARLWNGLPAGAGEPTVGTFINYELNMMFTGLAGVETAPGFFESSTVHPADVSGTFSGIFENQSVTDPSSNGFYRFMLDFNNTSWAYDNRADLNGAFADSIFGAGAVPEPSTSIAVLVGVVTLLKRRSGITRR